MPNPKFSIDTLRIRCWYRYLLCETGCTSNSELQERYEFLTSTKPKIPRAYQNLDIRWSGYAAGKNRPVANTLDAIEIVFGIDPSFYDEGPHEMLLWKALSTSSVDNLHKISNYSSGRLDGRIALERAKIISGRFDTDILIKLCDINEDNESRLVFFQTNFPDIYLSLGEYFDAKSTEDIINFFIEDIFPFAFEVISHKFAFEPYNFTKELFDAEFNRENDEMVAYENLRGVSLSKVLKK